MDLKYKNKQHFRKVCHEEKNETKALSKLLSEERIRGITVILGERKKNQQK